MEYIAPEGISHYADCEPLVSGLGYNLVELVVYTRQSAWHVKVVITSPQGVGIKDCSTVHRALLPRLEAVLQSQDMYVEVTSPGLDRVFKNASEFAVFAGRLVKIWDTDISDWVSGTIVSATTESVILATQDGERVYPYTKIAKAKLAGTQTAQGKQ